MKLLSFSDPHIDVQEKRGYPDFLSKMKSYIATRKPDVIVVAGDVGGSLTAVQKFLEAIDFEDVVKIYCPGNHDIWVNSKSSDASWVKYYEFLPELCKVTGWHYLPNRPLIVDNVAFVGTLGWYDYSTRNPKWDTSVSLEQYSLKYNESNFSSWMDREFAKFGSYDDKTITDHFNRELIDDLLRLDDSIFDRSIDFPLLIDHRKPTVEYGIDNQDKKFDTIVITSHMVPFLEFVRFTGSLDWDYFSAFIGNTKLGQIISAIRSNLRRISVFGHTHFPRQEKMITGVEAICCPIGYPSEWEPKFTGLDQLFAARIIETDI